METKFVISEVLKGSWKSLKEQVWVMAGLYVAFMIISGILDTILSPLKAQLIGRLVSVVIGMVFSSAFMLGYLKNCFQTMDHEEPQFSAYGSQLRKIPGYILASLLYALIICIGMILLIVPGIYMAIRLQFYTCLIVEENMGPIDALKKSWQMTKGSEWPLFLLGLLAIGIFIVGILCLLVGVFVAIPLTYLMQCYVYRKLSVVEVTSENTETV